jgi:hypothetical protein
MENDENITEPSDEKRFLRFLPTNPLRHLKLLIVVLLHWVVVIGNFSAFFILAFQGLTPFGFPWYVCLPLCSFIILISFSRVLDCPMTRYENKLRVQVGKPTIKGFIGHYFLKPYMRRKIRKAREIRKSKEQSENKT